MKYQHDGSERANRILDMDVRFRAVTGRSTSPWTHAGMLEDESCYMCVVLLRADPCRRCNRGSVGCC